MTAETTRRGALAALAAASAAAACGRTPPPPAYSGRVSFRHGVASGDPGIDRVVIWTRVTPEQTGPVPVRWVVARDRGLTNVVQTGVFETSEARDYTVKIDCTGLRSGAPYFYGFLAGDQRSEVGRTRTLPVGRVSSLTMGVVSGASHPHGFFNVYDALADRRDLELIVCLGDYLFTNGVAGFGGEIGMSLGRLPRPEIACVSLADYRQRHAQYKAEAELQRAHALCPWILAWDDQESVANAWGTGAPGVAATDWPLRRRAALQAYYEWMPVRDPQPGAPLESIFRDFQFGNLITLVMMETRHVARSRPFSLARETPLYSTPWDFSNPRQPRPVSPAARYPDHVRLIPVPYDEIGGRLAPIWDWARIEPLIQNTARPPEGIRFVPDRGRLASMLGEPSRQVLGAQQQQWIATELATSHRFGVTWQVLANEGLFAPLMAPDLSRLSPASVAALERAMPGVGQALFYTRFGTPLSTQGWDGYPAARARLLSTLRSVGGNAIFLTGDGGGAFANEIKLTDGTRIAAEFAAPSVTAPGIGDALASAAENFIDAVRSRNPHVQWMAPNRRGFLVATFEPEQARFDFFTVSTVAASAYEVEEAASFVVSADSAPGVGPIAPAPARAR